MNIYISLIITMLFSAFFSGMEIAFVSVDKLRFEMERKGGITSRILSIFSRTRTSLSLPCWWVTISHWLSMVS